MQPGLQPGFHAGPTPMQIKAQMKADIMHVDFLPDSDISDDRVITKYFVSKLDPVPLTTKPEDRERVLNEISERAREHDAECAQMVEHIEPLGAMQELLLDGEEELLSLNGECRGSRVAPSARSLGGAPAPLRLLPEASQELLRSLRGQRRPCRHVRAVHACLQCLPSMRSICLMRRRATCTGTPWSASAPSGSRRPRTAAIGCTG